VKIFLENANLLADSIAYALGFKCNPEPSFPETQFDRKFHIMNRSQAENGEIN
jgi:hypothetical protein